MLRFAGLALVACSFLAITTRARTHPAAPQAYGFCTLTDSSSVLVKIWASPVSSITDVAKNDAAGFQRSQELAGEFLSHVGTRGAGGVKSCVILPTRGEVATVRKEQRAIWEKRVYFVEVGVWRKVV